MVEATDPINPVNPFFYSFGPFLAKIRKIQKPIKILLIFPIFPFKGGPGGICRKLKLVPCRNKLELAVDGRRAGRGLQPHPSIMSQLGRKIGHPLKGKIIHIKWILIGFGIFRILAKNGPNE